MQVKGRALELTLAGERHSPGADPSSGRVCQLLGVLRADLPCAGNPGAVPQDQGIVKVGKDL